MPARKYPDAVAAASLDQLCLEMGAFYLSAVGKNESGELLYTFTACLSEWCEEAVAEGHHAWRKDRSRDGKWRQIG